ncbi:MAG: helix-turn-helix domain-containing protein, partial [Albidovulum sp.]
MHKPIRMLEIIATLRRTRQPQTAVAIAERLGTSRRTIYRDIAALQAMGVPIDGAAGLGYI